jgi:hypothetical protein
MVAKGPFYVKILVTCCWVVLLKLIYENLCFVIHWFDVSWVLSQSNGISGCITSCRKPGSGHTEGLDVKPIPLSITDVLLFLQTGMVNTVYSSTQGALSFQWFTKVKHVTRLRMGYSTGGVLISKKKFDKLPPSYQYALKKNGEECLQELAELIQRDNLEAYKVLEKNNVKWVSLPGEKEKARFQEAGARVQKS